jgi:hypothetical protein
VSPRSDLASSAGVAAVTISADAIASSGEPLDLADTEATITLPDGSSRTIPLRQIAPGRYAEDVALPADGPYAIAVRQQKDGAEREANTGYVQQASAEYLPSQGGAQLLEQISQASGGTTLSNLDSLAAPPVERQDAPGLWFWLLAAAALLWPIEIAVRRLRLGRS